MQEIGLTNQKRKESADIEAQVKAFKDKGGKVTKLPSYMESTPQEVNYNSPFSITGFKNNDKRKRNN